MPDKTLAQQTLEAMIAASPAPGLAISETVALAAAAAEWAKRHTTVTKSGSAVSQGAELVLRRDPNGSWEGSFNVLLTAFLTDVLECMDGAGEPLWGSIVAWGDSGTEQHTGIITAFDDLTVRFYDDVIIQRQDILAIGV